MHFPHFMRRINRVFTNRVFGAFAWFLPPLAVVHHVGRKSGRRYQTPVVAFRTATGVVIPMTYGRDVDWARNLVSTGGGELEQMGTRFTFRNPRVVDGDAAYPLLPVGLRSVLSAADFPGYLTASVTRSGNGRSRPAAHWDRLAGT